MSLKKKSIQLTDNSYSRIIVCELQQQLQQQHPACRVCFQPPDFNTYGRDLIMFPSLALVSTAARSSGFQRKHGVTNQCGYCSQSETFGSGTGFHLQASLTPEMREMKQKRVGMNKGKRNKAESARREPLMYTSNT